MAAANSAEFNNDYEYVWTIENFWMHRQRPGECIISEEFILNSLPYVKWRLELFPRGDNDCEYTSIYLAKNEFRYSNSKIMCKISVSNSAGVIQKNSKEILLKEFSYHSEVLVTDANYFPRYLSSRVLIVQCHLRVLPDDNDLYHEMVLSRDLETLYKSGSFANIVLCSCDEIFLVHKCILDAMWPTVSKMLDATSTQQVNLDISPTILDLIVRYMYTGKIERDTTNLIPEISEAVVKYKLDNLVNNLCSPFKKWEVTTRIHASMVHFNWPISGFSSLPASSTLRSFKFSVEIPHTCDWSLKLNLTSDDGNTRNFEIALCKEPDAEVRPVLVKSKIGKEGRSVSAEHIFLGNEEINCACLSSNSHDLNLKGKFMFSNMEEAVEITETSCSDVQPNVQPCGVYTQNLRMLFEGGIGSDLAILIESETFCVHKAILNARSSVFKGMLKEMTEPEKESIVITDTETATMKELLEYIYTANLKQCSSAQKLYVAALKYGVPALKTKCQTILEANLSVKNVCEVLLLANVHEDKDLDRIAKTFISSHSDEILRSKEWITFSEINKDLAFNVLSSI